MLEIKQLKFKYDKNAVADMWFDLDIKKGEILSVVGASGSGKTTLLNIVAGFNEASSGEILLDGGNILQLPVEKRPVTTVFQAHNLFPHLDVYTNVAIGLNPSLKLSSEEDDAVSKALFDVGLEGIDKRLPSQLSGGQQQRIALARALVRKQKILLLDEPLAALGPSMRDEIIDLLKVLVEENEMAALFVSHQPSDAYRASARCAFIHQGQVLALGGTASVLSGESHAAIREYLGD